MAYIYDLTDTWSAGGTVFNAIKINVTDSASAVTSKLVSLQTNGTEHFSVTKAGAGYFSGSVAIGITPLANTRISVRTATVTDTAYYADNGVDSGFKVKFASSLTSILNDFGAALVLGTNDTERMRIASDGTTTLNVGGVSNTHQFNYNESGGEIQLIDSTGAGPILIDNVSGLARFYKIGTGAMSIGTTGANYLQMITNGTERMRIDSSGNVGIGTTSPTTISGYTALKINNATNGAILDLAQADTVRSRLVATSGSFSLETTGTIPIIFAPTGAEKARIDSSGNVGIGTSSPAGKIDYISGSARVYMSNQGSSGFITAVNTTNTAYAPFALNGSELILKTGDAERARIDSLGQLGIGTSSPGYRLDVAAGDTTAGLGYGVRVRSNATAAAAAIQFTNSPVSAENGLIACTDGGRITVQGSTDMAFRTNGAERARIDSSGNVGIGTASPVTKLDVYGGLLAGSENRQTHPNANGPGGFKAQWNYTGGSGETDLYNAYSGATLSFRFYQTTGNGTAQLLYDMAPTYHVAYTGGTERMRIDSLGNVGIGTSSPTNQLDVVGIASARSNISTGNSPLVAVNTNTGNNTTKYTSLLFQGYDTVGTAKNSGLVQCGPSDANYVTSYMAFQTRSGDALFERARIDSSGNLLVGKTSTSTSVTGFVALPTGFTATNDNAEAGDMNRQSSDGGILLFRRAQTQVGSITVAASSTAYNTSSDYRLKKVQGPITNSGAYIDALNPVQGSWKVDGSRFIGLLAHEVQEVSETSIATGEKDGEEMQAMDYSAPELIANLIAEIQSLRARVAQLEGN